MRRLLLLGILTGACVAACGGSAFTSQSSESEGEGASSGHGGSSGSSGSSGTSGGSSGSSGSSVGGASGTSGPSAGGSGAGGSSGGAGTSGGISGAGGSGGSAGSATGGSAGTTGGTSGVGGSGGTGGASGSGGKGGSGGGPVTCSELQTKMAGLLVTAKQCCAACAVITQCTGSVPGPCCPQTVSSMDSAATQEYLAAYQAWQDAGCNSGICPAIACIVSPSYTCLSTGTCQ